MKPYEFLKICKRFDKEKKHLRKVGLGFIVGCFI